jgi:small-conductance mechanosensitive channel
MIPFVGIHVLVPLIGMAAFVLLCRKMQRTTQSPPFLSYFILFAIFGGWLMVCLTALFWRWSGLASIGVAALVLVAPFVTAGVAIRLRSKRTISTFHRGAYFASIAYCCLTFAVLGWLGWDFHSRWTG